MPAVSFNMVASPAHTSSCGPGNLMPSIEVWEMVGRDKPAPAKPLSSSKPSSVPSAATAAAASAAAVGAAGAGAVASVMGWLTRPLPACC
ncbi:unnamed protein product [Closterium sp. NIES-65]|nr:unnamed protein product [Closterium sp. NIES-65]